MRVSVTFVFFLGTVLVSIVALQGSAWFSLSGSEQSTPIDAPARSTNTDDDGRVPLVLQNFAEAPNKYLNKVLIPTCLSTSYRYLMMATYFSRADVALPGFAKYFKKFSERELDNANNLIAYINKRGGIVDYRDVPAPDISRWTDGVEAVQYALGMEKVLNTHFHRLHEMAESSGDPHLVLVMEDQYLDQKVKVIKEVADHLANLERMRGDNYGLGEYIFDENLQ